MNTVYVDRQGMTLSLKGDTLELRAEGERVRTLPLRLVQRVVLRADTVLTSSTLAAMADAGIGVTAFGGRGGQRVAHLVGAPAADCRARLAQARLCVDPQWSGGVSQHIVRGKTRHQRRVLGRWLDARADLRKPLSDAIARLAGIQSEVARCQDRDRLRGLEGAAAAAYFGGLRHLFAPALGFTARRRRPPPDAVNATLSLGYTLLHGQAVQACWAAGLDPMVGFLHTPSHARASLACDLMEPWRAEVDLWVVEAFRDRALRAEHFGQDGAGACLMGKAARSHLYAGLAPTLRRSATGMRRHARALATALRAASPDELWASESDDEVPLPASSAAEQEV